MTFQINDRTAGTRLRYAVARAVQIAYPPFLCISPKFWRCPLWLLQVMRPTGGGDARPTLVAIRRGAGNIGLACGAATWWRTPLH